MDQFERYFQQELIYLRELEKLACEEKPHLNESLSGQDPDVARLNEGFAALMARLNQKINDGFPELTQPLLQRLQAQSVKGIPATCIVQIEGGKEADFAFSLPSGTKVQTPIGQPFITTRQCDVQPLRLVGRAMTHQDQETQLTLTFEYTGKDDHWDVQPIELFLSRNGSVADSLLLGLCRYCYGGELHHNGQTYVMETLRFVPRSGTDRLVLSPPVAAGNWAPQMLMESFYLPHVHHFLTLDMPYPVKSRRLPMVDSRTLTLTLKLDTLLSLSDDQLAEAFLLHCVPVVNLQLERLIQPFKPDTARYPLPLSSHQGLLHIAALTLKGEPNEQGRERGEAGQFYPVSQLTGMSRNQEEYDNAWFYGLDVSRDALGRLEYALVFYDSNAKLMKHPPRRQFTCHFVSFNPQPIALPIGTDCLTENLPDRFQIRTITPISASYPPVIDSQRHWRLMSHYSMSSYVLLSVEAFKQLLRDYDFYSDSDRPISRQLRRMIEGIQAIKAEAKDRLVKGLPHRCLYIELTLDENAYASQGELFRFADALYQFLPFFLSNDMLMLMDVTCQPSGEQWRLSPLPLWGYRPIM
ncbi:type VI secretion system baseplate subunit TssF [Xenorhabdus sp. DI]|uniref:type VI secretion system baseplate subunit TssF n=1 Tax=Xenorhabdus doucetiae TaxID=351671 RepID=UPI00198AC133|nr:MULTISPECIES: type VI secretion system baseplate subunit TssF [unclassified Xenorhabdus]MBD2786368.1 type VI secretion system baseplate subunit TssF [Xenorhabdus sp. 3]MBD2787379.1 type VI secretion system baseplate subunit TssF [Xenorhabdus sp. DI]